MPLNPIRFHSSQDVLAFFKHLEDSGSVSFEQTVFGQTYVKNSMATPRLILQSRNGEFYYKKEVEEYFKNEEPANFPDIKFLTTNKRVLGLAHLKKNPDLLEQLNYLSPTVFNGCSPNLYSDPREITFHSIEQIQSLKTLFSNENHMKAREFIRSQDKQKLSGWEYWTLWDGILPLVPAKNFISSMYQDFLKITFFQQCQLQQHIMNSMKVVKDNDMKEALRLWKEELGQNNRKIKKFLETKIEIVRVHQTTVKTARKMYTDFLEKGLTLPNIQRELADLQEELAQERAKIDYQLQPQEKRKSLIKAGIVIGGVAIFLIAVHLVVVPSTLIFFPSFFIYALGVTVLASLIIGISTSQIAKAIRHVDHSKEKRLRDELEHMELGNKIFSWGRALKNEAFNVMVHHDEVIKSLEEDLGKMVQYERNINKIMNKKPSIFSFNYSQNIFKKGKKDPEEKELLYLSSNEFN